MSSNIQSEIDSSRQRIFGLETENAELEQIIEENMRRETENSELKSRVGELDQT